MRNEDRDLEPDYLEEHLVRRRHAISDHAVGLSLFAVAILAMTIGLDSVPAQTASIAARPLSTFFARLATPCIPEKIPSGGGAEAMRLYAPERSGATEFALRELSSRSVTIR
ncbi:MULTISPECIES: hypothetical protein [unclassified Sinorhizobium]|uniref:hypothetical protein n=1 Tax=unclassified Sinorhizobium TaxID=2613772 RepID=UPI003523F8B3